MGVGTSGMSGRAGTTGIATKEALEVVGDKAASLVGVGGRVIAPTTPHCVIDGAVDSVGVEAVLLLPVRELTSLSIVNNNQYVPVSRTHSAKDMNWATNAQDINVTATRRKTFDPYQISVGILAFDSILRVSRMT